MRDLSLHLLDIIQNSIAAHSSEIGLEINVKLQIKMLEFVITDNGSGMDKEMLLKVTSPFVTTRTTRKIGLGIPLFKASSEQSGGVFTIDSQKGKGTVVKATYGLYSIDRPPLGNISDTITGVILSDPKIRIKLLLNNETDQFKFDTQEVIDKLGEVDITEFNVLTWINEYIEEGIKLIFGGVLDEVIS